MYIIFSKTRREDFLFSPFSIINSGIDNFLGGLRCLSIAASRRKNI